MPRNQKNKLHNIWAFPYNASKAHYFVKDKALCGGVFTGDAEPRHYVDPVDKCQICARKARK